MKNALIALSTFALSLSTFAGSATAQARAGEPAVRVWLSDDANFDYGDRAKTYIQTLEDGYVVVLHATTTGLIRPLFPLRPRDDQYVRGGKKIEIKGLGGRESFVVDDTTGSGTVLVAFSRSAFVLSDYERNGHWDYRALADSTAATDPEAALMDIVQRMQPSAPYQYDLATYVVHPGRFARRPGLLWPYPTRGGWWLGAPYYGRPGVTVSVGIGSRFGRPYYYDPFYYDPFWYRPIVRVPIGRWRY